MILNQILNHFETFIFVFVRVLSTLLALPFLGSRNIPLVVKIALALILGVVITPVIRVIAPFPVTIIGFMLAVFREILIGVVLGFTVKFIFAAVEMAGQVTGIQMGFAVANVMDPQTMRQISVMAHFYNLLAVLLFFSLNVHLFFISAIKESFEFIPPYEFVITRGIMDGLLLMTGEMFKIAVKLAAPIMVAILLVNIALGVLSRAVPQLNVFVIGFPVTIILGFIILFFSLPFVLSFLHRLYLDLSGNVFDLLSLTAGG